MAHVVPKLDTDFFCIVDREQPELAAVISSYLNKPGCYLTMFEYPPVDIEKKAEGLDAFDENVIMHRRSEEFNIYAGNSLRRMGGCKNLILAGLSKEQRSYLSFLGEHNLIEIHSIQEIDFLLGHFIEEDAPFYPCRPSEIQSGLYHAIKQQSKLRIKEDAEQQPEPAEEVEGLVVIEQIDAVSTIIAVNYALSINARIKIVKPLEEDEEKEILYLIKEWRKGTPGRLDEIHEKIHSRIAGIYFSQFDFVTFFTEGLPYSLTLRNVIPFSYVHLMYRCDLFIFNNIIIENQPESNAAIVFSPRAFAKKEETDFVVSILKANNIYVRELIGEEATSYNIDMHVKEFPFDLLHFCSHGGEVSGSGITTSFKDRDGNTHTVEYDEVVSIAPAPGMALIPVTVKNIWRSFDGLRWRGNEFKKKKYPHYVFSDMQRELQKQSDGKLLKRIPVDKVSDSWAIKCYFSNYQAMFDLLAGYYTSPLIFNNTCWSWSGIADSFLWGGSRGYIGTLWAIRNDVAMQAAETFYNHLFNGTILEALQRAIVVTRGTPSEDIYMYWGLHFSTFKKGKELKESRMNTARRLMKASYLWEKHLEAVTDDQIRQNTQQLVKWNADQVSKYFRYEEFKMKFEFLSKFRSTRK